MSTKRIQRLAPGFDPSVAIDELTEQFEPDAVCPECDRAVDPEWSFCEGCGASLDGVQAGSGAGERGQPSSAGAASQRGRTTEAPACPGCGRSVDPAWDFCESCGTQLQ